MRTRNRIFAPGTLGPGPPLPSNLNYYNIDHLATCTVLLPRSLGVLGSPLFTGATELPATILLLLLPLLLRRRRRRLLLLLLLLPSWVLGCSAETDTAGSDGPIRELGTLPAIRQPGPRNPGLISYPTARDGYLSRTLGRTGQYGSKWYCARSGCTGPGFSWSSLVLSHLSLVLGGIVGHVLVGVHGRVDEEAEWTHEVEVILGRFRGALCHRPPRRRGLEPLRGALRPSPGGNQGRVSLSDAGKRGTTIDIRPSDATMVGGVGRGRRVRACAASRSGI